MKCMKHVILTLIFIFAYHIINQIVDYKEARRFAECTLKTNDFNECNKASNRSYIYNVLLALEVPRLSSCVWPGGQDNILCIVFDIKRSD